MPEDTAPEGAAEDTAVDGRPRVALFCTNFLPYSQSFVFEELQAHRRYAAEVFTWKRLCADRFPYEPVHVANPAYILTRYSPAFIRRFHTRAFSLLHAHFGPGGTYALPYARRFDLPLVVTFHGYDVPLLASPTRLWPLHWPYALRGPHLLQEMTLGLCASTELYDMLRQMGVPKERLAIYRLGVDVSTFAPGERDSHRTDVVMIGRFVEKKGFAYGIQAFASALEKTDRPAHLTLVGSGDREPELRRWVDRLGLNDKVRFAGVLDKHGIAKLLSRSHVLLAPSVVAAGGNRESGLIVVKEASASECVAIGTRHGGIPEIIDDGVTGFLTPERDVEGMAKRLATLIEEPALRTALGSAARAKMLREYDSRSRVAELEHLYDQALSMHRRQGRPAPEAPAAARR
jgi:colanic acid/amylovoran biosynthesis glycosyltransferase